MRRVEAEQPRLDLLDGKPAHRAGEPGRKYCSFRGFRVLGIDNPVRQRQRGLETVGQPGGDPVAHHHPVHHRLDLVLDLAVQRRHLADLVQRAVHLYPGEPAPLQLAQFLAVFALAVAHHRRQQQQPRALRHRHHPVHHLADRLRLDRQARRRRVRHPRPRPQQAHIILDLRHRADGGARVLAGGLLLDGDRRRQPVDRVDIRLSHQFQKLAGIGRQAFDIPPLPLGIDRVERQRGFARPRQPRQHRQLVARDLHVDVLEVMLPGATHDNGVMRADLTHRSGSGHS